jgi:hypothetical protein
MQTTPYGPEKITCCRTAVEQGYIDHPIQQRVLQCDRLSLTAAPQLAAASLLLTSCTEFLT